MLLRNLSNCNIKKNYFIMYIQLIKVLKIQIKVSIFEMKK